MVWAATLAEVGFRGIQVGILFQSMGVRFDCSSQMSMDHGDPEVALRELSIPCLTLNAPILNETQTKARSIRGPKLYTCPRVTPENQGTGHTLLIDVLSAICTMGSSTFKGRSRIGFHPGSCPPSLTCPFVRLRPPLLGSYSYS
jgi:hypothetical protein